MLRFNIVIFLILSIYYANSANAVQHHQSNYAGQEKRIIKSLSEDDIQQLKGGKGWGLAKAAELNGIPGPLHILHMKDKILLTEEQEVKVRILFKNMKSKAIPLGNELIELEKKLNDTFANGTITNKFLNQQLNTIYEVRKKLRYVHLATHLMTPNILTRYQIQKYNRLQGYSSGGPCKNLPESHDKEMWKKYNDCK